MARVHKPTGRPVGRPRKLDKFLSRAEQESIKATLLDAIRKVAGDAPNNGETPPEKAAVGAHALAKQAAITLREDADIGEAINEGLQQLIRAHFTGLSEALEKVKHLDPKAYVALTKDLLEFIQPKLARIEQTGKLGIEHSLFVHVESREEPPPIDVTPQQPQTPVVPLP
ncbi:MAG: hypothetical protein NZ534_00095 [Bacteroidia bacterium]|nr:hypothetical protein [Bacteroidia bacterium]